MENDPSYLILGYLQRALSAQEENAFYAWIGESQENKKLYFETKAIYDTCKTLNTTDNVYAGWNRLLKKKAKFHRLTLWNQLGKYAAVALIAITVSSLYFLLPSQTEKKMSTVYVGGDGLIADKVILPDGTEVSLGTKTTFYCENTFGKSTRTVVLEGEAFFKVAKQKDKPFIVKANGQNITALGTQFNVMAYPSDSTLVVTLLEGSVEIATAHLKEHTILKPNEQLIYHQSTHSTDLLKVEASQFSSWIDGYYHFPSQSLNTILHRLSNIYGVKFHILSDHLGESIFTGTFYRGQSLKDIMEIIHLSIPIQYKIEGHQVSLSTVN